MRNKELTKTLHKNTLTLKNKNNQYQESHILASTLSLLAHQLTCNFQQFFSLFLQHMCHGKQKKQKKQKKKIMTIHDGIVLSYKILSK